MTKNTTIDHPVIIIGSGIAGLTAAIYAGRNNNDPLILKGDEPGGQLTLTTDIANYPGFPEGISGPDLVSEMTEQSEKFGATFENAIVDNIVRNDDETFTVETTSGDEYQTHAVIPASGASARTLGVEGEDDLFGYGVSTCATCDGAFFRDEEMVVVGGGDAALEEASFLTRFASKVYIVHRRDEFRAEAYWQDEVEEYVEDNDIEILWNTEVTQIHGSAEDGVNSVSLVEHPEGHPTGKLEDSETKEYTKDIGAVFIAIGHTPNTSYLETTEVELDEEGYIETAPYHTGIGETETLVPGIFAAGDVVDSHYQQAVTAAGMGSKAALDVDDYLSQR